MNVAWLSELVLEVLGCSFFFRRKFSALWVWLAFRAISDVLCWGLLHAAGQRAYIWAEYFQRNTQYAFLAVACVACVAGILREHRKALRGYQGFMAAIALIGVVVLHAKWPPSADKVLLFEAGAECFLAGFIVLAMAQVNLKVPQPWELIAAALLLLTGSDATVTMLARQDWSWASWYPAGAIPALALLCWAGWKDLQFEQRIARRKAEDFRRSLGDNFSLFSDEEWVQ